MGVAESKQGLWPMRTNRLHECLGEERYCNSRRWHLAHRRHVYYVIPAGTWCSTIHAGMQVIKMAFQIIMTNESPKEVRIVSDEIFVLLLIAILQPDIHHKKAVF